MTRRILWCLCLTAGMPVIAYGIASGYGAFAIPFVLVCGILSGRQQRFVGFFMGVYAGLMSLWLVGLLLAGILGASWGAVVFGLSIPFAVLAIFKAGTIVRVRLIDARRQSQPSAS